MKAFIIGAAGFVGKHLIDHLRDERGWSIVVSKLPHEQINTAGVEIYDLDILDKNAVQTCLQVIQPDCIFHLAALSSVALSWKEPGLTVDINIKGSLNVLDAVRTLTKQPRVLLIGSGEEYGLVLQEEIPITEENNLRPGNIYAATKACQGMIGKIYANAYNMDIMMIRAFNHIGAGQAPMFVVSDFCKQVAEIEAGKREPIIRVGNLSAKRDFTNVRDVIRAYSLLMEKGKSGETYNVGQGVAISVDDILKIILANATRKIQIEIDPDRLRPVDIPIIEANIDKLTAITGWHPVIPLERTLVETLNYWRNIVAL